MSTSATSRRQTPASQNGNHITSSVSQQENLQPNLNYNSNQSTGSSKPASTTSRRSTGLRSRSQPRLSRKKERQDHSRGDMNLQLNQHHQNCVSSARSGTGPNSRASSECSSPTKPERKVPPIKAPVGLAKGPDLASVSSKIGSLDNVKHRPMGGDKKIPVQKLRWNAASKIGSLENASHKPAGGNVKIESQKLQWDSVRSKVGSLDNVKHQPGGGNVQIFNENYVRTPSPGMTPRSGNSAPGSPLPTEKGVVKMMFGDRALSPTSGAPKTNGSTTANNNNNPTSKTGSNPVKQGSAEGIKGGGGGSSGSSRGPSAPAPSPASGPGSVRNGTKSPTPVK